MKIKTLFGFHIWIFGSIWLFLFAGGRSKLFRDPGSFSHTAIGEHILQAGHLIYQDSYSFTCFGEQWIAQQWLGECIMAAIHRVAGLDGLLVVTASLIALLYSHLALRIERSGMNLALGTFVLSLSLAAASHHLHVRPHVATIFFMAVLYLRLSDIEAEKTSPFSLPWLIPMFVIWSNIHGGVLGGLFTFLIVAAGWTLASQIRGNGPIRGQKQMANLWGLILLCFITPLVNPYGLDLPSTWLDIMSSKAISEVILEHASVLTLLQHGGSESFMTIAILFSLGLFYFALLAGTDRKDRRIIWYVPLVWFFLSISRIRHAPLFAVMAVVAIAEMFPACRWVRCLGDRGLVLFRMRKTDEGTGKSTIMGPFVAAIVTVAALLAFHGSAQLPSTDQKWVKLDRAYWPLEILPELQALEKGHSQGTPIFNDFLFGGFLIYHTPGLRVFIDDRCELYGDDLLVRYVKADRSDFEAWAKRYRYNFALLSPDSNYRKYFEDHPDWRVVKRSRAAVLYEKCLGRNPDENVCEDDRRQ